MASTKHHLRQVDRVWNTPCEFSTFLLSKTIGIKASFSRGTFVTKAGVFLPDFKEFFIRVLLKNYLVITKELIMNIRHIVM